MKLNYLTQALIVAVALLGVVPVQAKPEIYVTENNSNPIEYVNTTSPHECDGYEVVEQVYIPRKTYRNNKRQTHRRYYVEECNQVTMGDAANAVVYTAGVGTLAYLTVGLISKVFFGVSTALSLL